MINSAVTIAPEIKTGAKINANKTLPPTDFSMPGVVLNAGDTISDSFVISSAVETKGAQSDVYIAKKSSNTYAIKVYRNGWRPSSELEHFLATVRHPNIARVVESGVFRGSYYEIYEYFQEGTLESAGKLPLSTVINVLVPSINEGLHHLHKKGIVHCDIKPSNLFFSGDRSRLVIGDLAVSGFMNDEGIFIDTIRGTPEYSPGCRIIGTKAVMTPAYDYGSFGLVLCKAILGRSLFEGMSADEIALRRSIGITLPPQISGRLENLIYGLLDENENKRWGYDDVRRWCNLEYTPPQARNVYNRAKKKDQKIKPLVFGRFDNNTIIVTTLGQLSDAIKEHWDQARNIIKRPDLLIGFVRQFDESLVPEIKKLGQTHDPDAAVFRLYTCITGGSDSICYCGKIYTDLADYVEKLSSGRDETALKFLTSGMLVYFLRYNGKDEMQIDKLDQLIKRSSAKDMDSIKTICFALQGTRTVEIYGRKVGSIDEAITVIAGLPVGKIDALLHESDFLAWLSRMGYERDVRKMKEEFR